MSYGIKVSIPQNDVLTAPDFGLLSVTDAPSLKVFHSGAFSVTDGATHQVVYSHGLGYRPLFIPFLTDATHGSIGSSVAFSATSADIHFRGGLPSGATSGFVLVFDLDLDLAYAADANSSTGLGSGTDSAFGILVAKPGSEVLGTADLAKDTDIRNYSLDSTGDNITPLVHVLTHGSIAAGDTMTVTHNLGYVPLSAVYVDLVTDVGDPASPLGSTWISVADDFTVTAGLSDVLIKNNTAGSLSVNCAVFKDKYKAVFP